MELDEGAAAEMFEGFHPAKEAEFRVCPECGSLTHRARIERHETCPRTDATEPHEGPCADYFCPACGDHWAHWSDDVSSRQSEDS